MPRLSNTKQRIFKDSTEFTLLWQSTACYGIYLYSLYVGCPLIAMGSDLNLVCIPSKKPLEKTILFSFVSGYNQRQILGQKWGPVSTLVSALGPFHAGSVHTARLCEITCVMAQTGLESLAFLVSSIPLFLTVFLSPPPQGFMWLQGNLVETPH